MGGTPDDNDIVKEKVINATVAQLAERHTCNVHVRGSIPLSGSKVVGGKFHLSSLPFTPHRVRS